MTKPVQTTIQEAWNEDQRLAADHACKARACENKIERKDREISRLENEIVELEESIRVLRKQSAKHREAATNLRHGNPVAVQDSTE